MPAAALLDLANQFDFLAISPGEVLIHQGEPGDCMYLVVSGKLQVISAAGSQERVLADLGPGDLAGEIALWTCEPRTATVRAADLSSVAKMTRAQFDQVAAQHPEAAHAIDTIVGRRLRQNQLSSALRISKLFGDLDEAALRDLESQLELLWIEGGTTLFRQGDPGDALYLIVSGKLKIVSEDTRGDQEMLAEVGRGSTVGEMAVLDGEPRSATVIAARDSQVARLSLAGFEHLTAGRRALLSILAGKLVRRLRDRAHSPASYPPAISSIAIAPLSIATDAFANFSHRLATAFAGLGRIAHIDSAALDALAGRPGASQTGESEAGQGRVLELLNKLETDYRFVLYQADSQVTHWTSRCLRHCDHVVLVCEASANLNDTSGILASLHEHGGPSAGPGISLALVHRGSSGMPSGTRQQLAQLPQGIKINQHYHVRTDRDADFGRLARSLSGNAYGLVLGGGGARGLAHAGVIRALDDAGVPIDLVGGTSMGSYLAAGIGLGHSSMGMLQILIENLIAVPKDKTIPLVSFLTGAKTAEVLLAQTGLSDIEDLWIPFFCVSANLTRARVEVHREGPLAKYLLASSRVPGIYPPIVSNGDLLVDGGIINNIPVDIMRAWRPCGCVIASDVSPEVDLSGMPDYGMAVSGWRALRNVLKPAERREHLPSILRVLLRTVEFGGTAYQARHRELADLYLRPPVAGFKVTDTQHGDEMAEVAYKYSKPKIADWLEHRNAGLTDKH